jgi:hypothetical protein
MARASEKNKEEEEGRVCSKVSSFSETHGTGQREQTRTKMPPIDYSKWDNLSYSSSDEDETEEEEEEELMNKKIMQTNFANIVIGEPTKLWTLVTDWPDVFEKHVLLSGYLNGTDIKMFYESCRASRRAVKRAKIELQEKFGVHELSSISTMELAWEGYPWGRRICFPEGYQLTMNQEYFSSRVAETNDLKLLRWVREEKECDWDFRTSGQAVMQGNLDMLKYCCENGCEVHEGTCVEAAKYGNLACLEYLRSKNCPWDERVCEVAHKNNHINILTYAVKNKCPGFEAYEQFIPK